MKCYSRNVTYYVDKIVYFGTIQNLGNYGATIAASNPINIPKGKKICIKMLCENEVEIKYAEIAYTEVSSFGAKFV